MSKLVLAGDLGGTKTLLALAETAEGAPAIVREQRFDSRAYPDFETLLAEFLGPSPGRIESACFGIAGPTDGATAQLTYLPWHLDASALAARFDMGRVDLLNDFVAAARGIDQLQDDQLTTLQAGQPQARAPRVVVGAGTGVGVAGLFWQEGRYTAIPGEGGHVGFSPQTSEQADLWRYLFNHDGRVTVEDVLGGAGLARIYAFLGGTARTPAEIGTAAVNGSDPRATRTLDLWLSIYGAFAGDLALQWLAHGGVYIAGGIAAKLMPQMRVAPFLTAFRAKREYRALAETFPIRLVTEERLGLLGALGSCLE